METPAPSLVYVYAKRCGDGQYRIYDGEMTEELAAFQERMFANEDVRLLIHQIDRRLEEAAAADPALREYVDQTAAKYGLKSCRDIRTGKSRTPFICGLVRPVLVLPEDWAAPEEEIISFI